MPQIGSVNFDYLAGVVQQPRFTGQLWVEPGRDGDVARREGKRAIDSVLRGEIYADSASAAESIRDDVFALAWSTADVIDEREETHGDCLITDVRLNRQIHAALVDGVVVERLLFDITVRAQP